MKYILGLFGSLLLCSTLTAAQQNIVVVVDASGSMADRFSGDRSIRKIDAAKEVLKTILKTLPADSNVGVVVLPTQGWVYPLGGLNQTKLNQSVDSIYANGGTPLGRYMKDGANSLLELRNKQKYGVYKLIIVTDGESNDDCVTPLTGAYGILSKGIQVEAIGVDMDSDHTLATKIPYRTAKNPAELANAVKAVLAESSGGGHSEDYEMIASLDPKICFAALQALSQHDNAPIGMKPKFDENGNVMVDDQGNVILESSSGSSGGGLWIFLIVAGVALTIGFIVFMSRLSGSFSR